MATYYVRINGNDTSGDGSSALPWLTLSKAYSIAGAGDTIKVGDGLYRESTSGAGFWSIVKTPASWLTTEGENGPASRIGVMGLSHVAYNTLIQGATFLRFNYLRFLMRLSTTSAAVRISASASNLEYNWCEFWGLLDGVTYNYGMQINPADGETVDGVAYNDCTWRISGVEGTKRHVGLQLTYANLTGICRNITLTRCSGEGSRIGVEINGATGVTVDGGAWSTTGSAAIMVGADGSSGGKVSTATLKNLTAQSSGSGHALLIGNGATGCLVENVVVPEAYDYGLVLKEHSGTEVRYSRLAGGLYSALYCKAAQNANLHHNVLQAAGGTTTGVFQLGVGDTGNKNQNVTLRYNHLVALGAVNLLSWGGASADLGGGICDYNTYELRGSGTIGNVRSTSGITTLAGLQAAWSGYDVSGNDVNSRMATMAKLAGRHARVLFGGYDLSGWSRQVEGQIGLGGADVTGFGEGGENEAPAYWQFEMTVQAILDAAAGASHEGLKSAGGYSDRVVSLLLGANAAPVIGDEMISALVSQFQYDTTFATKAALAISARFGGQEFRPDLGLVLAYTTITATTNFASVNNGLGSSAGGVGYVQVTTPVLADSYAVKIQHSTDGSSWADLLSFTVDGRTRTSERVAVSGTVNAYLRAAATRTGSAGESLGLMVGFARY